ncbi:MULTISPECIES: globin domain-containing protein [unclassified Streptomyces]|uniref:nitric oxide dioxygenase n=1 Tax=Streptomyces johnsoniae TaxID=3075532 RepID=A0ABU2SAM3_9ACTN|nr:MULTISPECIES: globin domain-containing protein [unclassified Streptomyces]MDT0446019.1 globin domain-containing protein [Streptomyces sp. DSM 41886]ONK12838.1 Xylene monooxygenase electron transfer component [Streptomyces sp. MP131-18]
MTAISADDGATTTGSGHANGQGKRAPSPDAVAIRRTLAEIEPHADEATSYFYALLFLHNPGLRELFPPAMDTQRDRLFGALLTAAEQIDDTVGLTDYLGHLGRGHRKYGTRADHYPAVGEALIYALERYAPRTWDAAAEAAWVRAYTVFSQTMIDAAAEDELRAPPWWQAEIVSHERRTSEVAVVTVRPDQPYPYRAGQYASVETPWWPRVWRSYSFASCPRADGLLSFHVKAVPAGWVSRSLVHRARRGDVIRLGPPAGSMAVDHASSRGLLCVGGSTGIAPIKALVEDVAEHGRRRPVEVFFGANRDADLYDLDSFLDLERRLPWLSVRPVVAELATRGFAGRLPEAVREFGPWREFDGYLSGPPQMIRKSVDALVSSGVPQDRIWHDFLGTLVASGGR